MSFYDYNIGVIRSIRHYLRKDYDGSIAEADKTISVIKSEFGESDPKIVAYLIMADAALKGGEFSAARKYLDMAASVKPDHSYLDRYFYIAVR